MNSGNSIGAAHHGVVYRRAVGDILAVIAGFGSGTGLMYLLDLKRQHDRRSQDIAEFTEFIQQDGGAITKRRAKYLLDRVPGLGAKDVSIRRSLRQAVKSANDYLKKRSLFVTGLLTGVAAGIASIGKTGSARQLKC